MSPSSPDWSSLFSAAQSSLSTLPPPLKSTSKPLSPTQIAAYIDHTLLKLDATEAQITTLCNEAKKYHFGAVCVRLPFVSYAAQALPSDRSIKVACVIGFHEGTQSTFSKVEEARQAIAEGASELDVVLNRELLQSGQYQQVYDELKQLRNLALLGKVVLKLILETSQLSREEVIKAAVIAHKADFDFIKTSTGFCGRGASKDDVILMRACALYVAGTGGNLMKVKASGGVRGYEDARTMIELGAERIGASSGVKIVEEAVEFEKSGGASDRKKEDGEGDRDGY